ncbi:MAG: DoxX family membrane protein [Armatimonadota bacterium]|nr:DoxX family membrane protein [Armatimonadota bacterium]MDR5689638.1 DoxX family membrane protein [Armatimonadota bacterium]MDR7386152.1 DoxX family membrane protein [Armatimonadota bacterium]MDR7389436.1 DoxX family membrane protein [Armatimonadota bacterium]MDR7392277.1 DoxX family membrane protein [Armatimonadota bacterium]
MDALFLIGRIVLGAFYLFNALNHFSRTEMLSGYAASKGVPWPRATVLLTGLLLLVGGLSFLLGVYPRLGVAAVVVFLVPVAFWMHNFWAVQDPMQKTVEMVNFTKNLALAGSALMFLAIPEPWPLSVGG